MDAVKKALKSDYERGCECEFSESQVSDFYT
jgi:hypothetical protein